MPPHLKLISHSLCPYVQRAVISLAEKSVAFERVDIDLANKPDWFLALSPLGKTPVLVVEDRAIFESAVILEYLEETQINPLHPADPLTRAEHRGWMEFGSTILNVIAGLYSAPDLETFQAKVQDLSNKFGQIEARLGDGPFFDGNHFSLVDTVFGPIFRYFDVFDTIADLGVFNDKPKVQAWRSALAARKSIQTAVSEDYASNLLSFLGKKTSYLAEMISGKAAINKP
jgi:glutathione S-transferase